jgi:PAS domain S-box-containing protein
MTEERLQLLESAVNNTDEAVVIASEHPPKSHNFRIVYVNEAFTRITGYEFDEVVGNRPEMLQGPDTDPVHMEVLKKAFARQEHVNVELINYRKDGSEFWQELNIVPVKNTKGDVTHWVSPAEDNTTEKRRLKRR